jgi:hypothetical protein
MMGVFIISVVVVIILVFFGYMGLDIFKTRDRKIYCKKCKRKRKVYAHLYEYHEKIGICYDCNNGYIICDRCYKNRNRYPGTFVEYRRNISERICTNCVSDRHNRGRS